MLSTSARGESRCHHQGLTCDDLPGAQLDAGELVVGHHESGDLALDDGNAAGDQLLPLIGACGCSRVQEQGHVRAPLPKQQRLVHAHRVGGQHPNRLVAYLVAVAVGAVQHVASPALRQPGHVGQLVHQTGGHQQASSLDAATVSQLHPEPDVAPAHRPRRGDRAGDHLTAIARHLCPAGGQQVSGVHSLPAQVVVHVSGRGVARESGIDHQHRAACAPEGQRPAEPGGTTTDDNDVVGLLHCALLCSGHPVAP